MIEAYGWTVEHQEIQLIAGNNYKCLKKLNDNEQKYMKHIDKCSSFLSYLDPKNKQDSFDVWIPKKTKYFCNKRA